MDVQTVAWRPETEKVIWIESIFSAYRDFPLIKMQNLHKNKTFAAFLGLLLGAAGIHRFYLKGIKDLSGWLHAATLLLCAVLLAQNPDRPLLINTAPLVISVLISCIETFMIGLMPDEKWDALHNPDSGKSSESSWIVALLMVVNLAYGATLMLIALARSFDLILTGGSYG